MFLITSNSFKNVSTEQRKQTNEDCCNVTLKPHATDNVLRNHPIEKVIQTKNIVLKQIFVLGLHMLTLNSINL